MSLIYQFAPGRVLFNDEILVATPLFSALYKKEKREKKTEIKEKWEGKKKGRGRPAIKVVTVTSSFFRVIVTIMIHANRSHSYEFSCRKSDQ